MLTKIDSSRKKFASTLVEKLLIVAIIGLLALIAVGMGGKVREEKNRNACVANLKLIQAAKEVWARQKEKPLGATPADTDLFGPGAYLLGKPVCPSGGIYTINSVGQLPECSLKQDKGHYIPGG